MESKVNNYEVNDENVVVEVPEEITYDGFTDVNVSLGSGSSGGRSGCCSC